MTNKGRSVPNLFGGYTNYDERGRKIGSSRPGMLGTYKHYDNSGKLVGHSRPGAFGKYIHYDRDGKRTGYTHPGVFVRYCHYDSKGKAVGSTRPKVTGGYSHSSSQGCYVATCVYGDYDCPQVWTLRRFRDNTLAASVPGRAFIRVYYAVSPVAVKWFGEAEWFCSFWKVRLDRLVARLKARGVADEPYEDRSW